jgi:uncharacterized protein (DUF736 family)
VNIKEAGIKFGMEKAAGSKLRSMLKLVDHSSPATPDRKDFKVFLGKKHIGYAGLRGNQITQTAIMHSNLQGLGLGRKIYGELARKAGGTLKSDTQVSESAHRVWDSINRRKAGWTTHKTSVPRVASLPAAAVK